MMLWSSSGRRFRVKHLRPDEDWSITIKTLAGLPSTFKLVPQSCVSYMLQPAEKPHFNTKQFAVLTMCCVLVAYRTVKTRAVHASLWTNPLLTASRNSWSSGVEPSRSGPSSMLNPLDQNLIATRIYSTQVACGHAAPTNQTCPSVGVLSDKPNTCMWCMLPVVLQLDPPFFQF